MGNSTKQAVEDLFSKHSKALRAFFRRRIRASVDAQDLTQEVYLRFLRVNVGEVVRNPEAYLYVVASNLLKEYAVLERKHATPASEETLLDAVAERRANEDETDLGLQSRRLAQVLAELSPKCRTAVLLKYRDGLSYEQIGQALGVSSNMVKKYLSQALVHCRKRMQRWR